MEIFVLVDMTLSQLFMKNENLSSSYNPKIEKHPLERVFLLEEFLEYHTSSHSPDSSHTLSLCKRIFIVVNIHWHFSKMQMIETNLIDKLTRILHAIHGYMYIFQSAYTDKTISIMCICKMDSGNK